MEDNKRNNYINKIWLQALNAKLKREGHAVSVLRISVESGTGRRATSNNIVISSASASNIIMK
jgi:hypothetical protein